MSRKIDKVTIKGFKSLREIVDLELRMVNIIVGANGAGKSNFIQLFRMIQAMLKKNFQSYITEHGGADSFLHNGRKLTKEIFAEFKFGDNSYRFSLLPTSNENFSISEYRRYSNCNWNVNGVGLLESLLKDYKDEGSSVYLGARGIGFYIYKAISQWMVYHFHDTGDSAPMRLSEIVEDNVYLRGDAANLAPFLLGLRDDGPDGKRAYAEIVNAIRLVMPFFDDFILNPKNFGPATKVSLTWRQKGSDYPFQPYHLSDGSIRFICLAAALLQPNPPSTIIIDEPELGLHPRAIAILAELIKIASSRTQVIVATQSPLLIDHFDVSDILIARRKDGGTTLGRLNEEDFKLWLDEYTPGELLVNNIIEGGPVNE